MKSRDDLLNKLVTTANSRAAAISSDQNYPSLIEKLLIQSLIKIEEAGERAKRTLKQRRASAASIKINVMGTFCRRVTVSLTFTQFARRILSWHLALGADGA